ncbi:hypothetical protein LOK49_LG05G02740 [Camellia lanceoleosa]|uniref:Uncharacterized protein n=1 Tax=Camellia lanceoleosa TaxID=1840588 RepID=A0ACC0HLK3_9ERIC|nr:hypothetical protein LOK49_LG05G02740 [Camellia lanceoleosa]
MIDTIVISTYETKTIAPNLIISILIGLTITILILATFHVSGGHINPIISFSAAFVSLISFSGVAVYIVAQCLGDATGALALKAVVSSIIEQTFSPRGCTLPVIAPGPNGPDVTGLTMGQALWLEIICTFMFLFASIWIAFGNCQAKALGRVVAFLIVGLVIGLLVFISTTVMTTKGYSGAGMNPTRCFGPVMNHHHNHTMSIFASAMSLFLTMGFVHCRHLISTLVSYRWLSRNFLLPSNVSKRLLQEFVEKHGNGFEVVYTLSGWLKNNPSVYHIRLVSGPKIQNPNKNLIAIAQFSLPQLIIACEITDLKKPVAVIARKSRVGSSRNEVKTLTLILTARNIDAADVDNELAVMEYVEDIYKFYKLTEGESRVHEYMDSQPEINSKMRSILIDWLTEEGTSVGQHISSMLIACKYEEIRGQKDNFAEGKS